MESCEFQNVRGNIFRWKPFLRQVFVCSAIWSNDFLLGLSLGAPAVLIPQLRQEKNSTAAVSEEMESWLSSGDGPFVILWIFLLPFMAERYGRRITMLLVALNSIGSFTLFYCSSNVTQILISNVMLGAADGALTSVAPMIITEYTCPQYRGIMLTVKSASFYWGIWVANAIGTFLHWKHIGILGILCAVYGMTALLWPDSPVWLASKGRYRECATTHRWLQGSSNIGSEDELETSIHHTQKEMLVNPTTDMENRACFTNIFRKTTTGHFYKPFFLSVLILLLSCFSGKLVISVYALGMIKKMTNSTSAAYSGILILDGLTIFSAYIGCALTKVLKRRTLYLVASSISICFMLIISLHLYLIKYNIILENSIVSIFLLSGYSISTSCGPVILTGTLIIEIMPSKFKSLMLISVSLVAQIATFVLLKTSPMIFRVLGIHNTFLLYGIPSLILLYLCYKYLPETKDKTLFEIEEFFK